MTKRKDPRTHRRKHPTFVLDDVGVSRMEEGNDDIYRGETKRVQGEPPRLDDRKYSPPDGEGDEYTHEDNLND